MALEYRIRVVEHKQDVMIYDEDVEITWHARRQVQLAYREPGKKWRTYLMYLYSSPALARQEAWALVGKYLECGIPVEHNLKEINLEVSHGRG